MTTYGLPSKAVLQRPIEPTQYTSSEFTTLLTNHHITQSLSRPRQCWDNAVAESFFASLKLELIDRRSWATRAQVRAAVFDYIERFYNRRRLHSSLDYLTPVEYEARIHHHKAAHAA
jgi:putative transposase